MRMQSKTLFVLCILLAMLSLVSAGCSSSISEIAAEANNQVKKPSPSIPPQNTPTPITPSQVIQPSLTSTFTVTPTLTATVTASPSPPPTETPSPTVTPTYAILRGTVHEQANCRYGPGAAYLYKYGLYPESNLEIIGRNELGTWIVIQAIGGSNPCWVKASLLNIRGEVMSLAPASLPLPQSPYYGPLTGVNAQRLGNNVVVSWHPLALRAGDDSLQYPYLIEAWLCQDGQLVFTPVGSWETIISLPDEAGCAEPSHARIYGVEKHGYTSWVEIPWPQP